MQEKQKSRCKSKIHFLLYVKLSILMGLGWLFGVLASILKSSLLWYPFIIVNSLQGTFIFVFFDMKWKVYYEAYEKLMGKPHPDKRSNKPRTILSCVKVNENTISTCDTSNANQQETTLTNTSDVSASSSNFKKKGDLLVKLYKWKKSAVRSGKNGVNDLNEYNAWQQLEMFQKSLKENDEDNEAIEENEMMDEESSTKVGGRETEVLYEESKRKQKVKPMRKRRSMKGRTFNEDSRTKYSSDSTEEEEEDTQLNVLQMPPPYRHPPPYQIGPYKRRLSFTTIIKQTIFEDDFEEHKRCYHYFEDEAFESPGPIIELASSSDDECTV